MDTILIVDDEKNYPLILSAVLADEGFETLTAHSGQEALELLANGINVVARTLTPPSS